LPDAIESALGRRPDTGVDGKEYSCLACFTDFWVSATDDELMVRVYQSFGHGRPGDIEWVTQVKSGDPPFPRLLTRAPGTVLKMVRDAGMDTWI
jgi:hypothetical protein